jgi:hypothetical protein
MAAVTALSQLAPSRRRRTTDAAAPTGLAWRRLTPIFVWRKRCADLNASCRARVFSSKDCRSPAGVSSDGPGSLLERKLQSYVHGFEIEPLRVEAGAHPRQGALVLFMARIACRL